MPSIKWRCPVDLSGYGTSGMDYVRALDLAGWEVELVPHKASEILWCRNLSLDTIQRANLLSGNRVSSDSPYVQQCVPDTYDFSEKGKRKLIGYTPFEALGIPDRWRIKMNKMDEIWCPSAWNRDMYLNSGIEVPVRVVPHIVRTDIFHP